MSLVENPLHKEQHAYQEGESAETALAEVFAEIKKGMKCGFAITVLLKIEGVFNHTSVESNYEGAREHNVSDTVERWMWRLLNSSKVVVEWKKHEHKKQRKVWVRKRCQQIGVLSPTMWCLVVDRLLSLLSEAGFLTCGGRNYHNNFG